jgi:hypothetical protein
MVASLPGRSWACADQFGGLVGNRLRLCAGIRFAQVLSFDAAAIACLREVLAVPPAKGS